MKQLGICVLKAWTALVLLVAGATAVAAGSGEVSALNLRRGATEISGQVYDLHMLMFSICVGIAVVVFGIMFVSMYSM